MINSVSRPIVCPVVIGRAPALEALAAALHQARQGAGHTVLVSGEAGVGKSRLVREMTADANDQGMLPLAGNCYEGDRDAPFAPLLDLLRAYIATRSDDELRRLVDRSDPHLLTLLPEFAARLPDRPEPSPLDPEQKQRRLFTAIIDLLLDLAATQPMLLIIEDAHWADDTSLDLLLHLARRVAKRPLLLVITYRSDEVHPTLRHFLAGLDRERLADEIPLAPLGVPEVGAMLRAIFQLPRTPRGGLSEALHALTEGNPFFLEEVLHVLVADGDIFYAEGKWDRKPLHELRIPRSVHDTVQRRSQRVSGAAADVLAHAAVLGRRFDFALLRAVGGYDEAELLTHLKELIAVQLLVEESAERYAFRHALTRRAVYAELLARERRLLHRAAAETLQRASVATPNAALADLAYHYFEAGAWAEAMLSSQRVGEQALALFAPRAAVEHFTRALLAAERQGIAAPIDLLRARGRAYETLGEFERARSDYDAALERARKDGDAMEEWHVLRDLGVLWSGRDYTRAGAYYQSAFELARASGVPPTLARSMNSLGNWSLNIDEPLDARRHHEEALAIFEALGDQGGIAETLDLLGMTLYLSGDLVRGTQVLERAIALARELNERKLLASALTTMSFRGLTWQTDMMVPASTDLAAPLAELNEALDIARAIDWAAGEAYAHMILLNVLGTRGDYAAALASYHTGLEIAREIEHRQWICGIEHFHGVLHLDLFALAEARSILEGALELARAIGSWHWIRTTSAFLVLCLTQQGRLDEAAAILDQAAPPGTPMRSLGQRLIWCARRARACQG